MLVTTSPEAIEYAKKAISVLREQKERARTAKRKAILTARIKDWEERMKQYGIE